MKITRGKTVVPRRVMLYGTHGIGKSSWAAQAPDVLFLNLEDGLADIDCAKTERINEWDQFSDAIVWLAQQKHDFRTVAIDTVDWLETLIHKEVAKQAGKNSIADIGYGNGYKQANAYWAKMIRGLDWLRIEHGMTIILLAHSEIKKHQDPLLDSYDRYQPALHEQASATLQEWCDEVLFASYRVYTRKEDQGFDKKRTIASGESQRYLRCVETPAALAKNRLNMPGEIEFSWAAYAQHITGVSSDAKG